ncbi:LURP-one-related/scramblase family protein [Jannaschia sp. R86511]|uniref:LURP-one-related/scramblase family protein n=1 Tax=Jannaschia sp. R86511 TaxID=3093853 RepID=UPI0036D22BBC
MTVPAASAGWTRLLVKSTFGVGRDFAVTDPLTGERRYVVDGKLGPRPRAEVRDAADQVVYQVRGALLGIPKQMTVQDAAGTEVASLRAKMFSPVRSRMTMQTTGSGTWELEGSFLEKEYSISVDGRPVAAITQKWVTIRDTYTLDVADGTDPGLALAVLWAVDRWVERD